MMDDNIGLHRKKFRRKRKHVGDDISNGLQPNVAQLQAIKNKRGLMCRHCGKMVHWRRLTTEYTRDASKFYRRWICSHCGSTLKEERIL